MGDDRIIIVPAAVLAAIAGLLAVHGSSTTALVLVVAVAGIVGLLLRPAATLLGILIVCQEIDPSSGFGGAGGSSLLYLGHQVYFTTVSRTSLITFIVVLACAGTALQRQHSRPRLGALWAVCALALVYLAEVWLSDTSLTSAINQDCRFLILFAGAFYVGAGSRVGGGRDRTVDVLRWLLSVMTIVGLYLYATGQGAAVTDINVIFYDSAMGAIAGALLVAVVLTPPQRRDRRVWWAAAVALAVVILASRRDIWAGVVVALIVGLGAMPHRTRIVLRLLAATAAVLVALGIFDPSVTGAIGHQLAAIWQATQGSAADASVQGHLSDVSVGWRAVEASPWSGVGPNGQLLGLVVEEGGPLYIHNQELESWLRFGLLGALLVVIVQVVLVVQAVSRLRRDPGNLTTAWAAYLLILAPVAMLTAPFFTETQRWPAILGFAAGIIAVPNRQPPLGARAA